MSSSGGSTCSIVGVAVTGMVGGSVGIYAGVGPVGRGENVAERRGWDGKDDVLKRKIQFGPDLGLTMMLEAGRK